MGVGGRRRKGWILNIDFPNSQFPIPQSQFPTPNYQSSILNSTLLIKKMLSVLIFLPLIGAIVICLIPNDMTSAIHKKVALVVSTISFFWMILLTFKFNPGEISQQFVEFLPWIDSLGLNYDISVDGLSLPLLVLNALLT
jgi:hypothetical protein